MAVTLWLTACGGGEETAAASAGTSSLAVLNGNVVLEPRAPLQLDSVIRVRLADVSLADAPAMVIAQVEVASKGKASPFKFKLEYDPAKISERNRYALRAEVRDGQGRLQWTTTTFHPVFTQGAPADHVDVVVEQVTRPH
jgi:putative lipoprotein